MKNQIFLLFFLLFSINASIVSAQWIEGRLGNGVPSGATVYRNLNGADTYIAKVLYQNEIRFAELSASSFYIDARIVNEIVRIPAGTPITFYSGSFNWATVTNGALPANAMVASTVGDRKTYIIRAYRNGYLCLGRTERPARINGTAIWDGNDFVVSNYEVLVQD